MNFNLEKSRITYDIKESENLADKNLSQNNIKWILQYSSYAQSTLYQSI